MATYVKLEVECVLTATAYLRVPDGVEVPTLKTPLGERVCLPAAWLWALENDDVTRGLDMDFGDPAYDGVIRFVALGLAPEAEVRGEVIDLPARLLGGPAADCPKGGA
jgi:hypothetical protein